MAVIAVIVGWWLSQQRLTAKPWLEDRFESTTSRARGAMTLPAAKIGLGVFLAVVGSLFALFVSAYLHAHGHGRTGAPTARAAAALVQHRRLVLSSVALQWAVRRRAPGQHGRCQHRPAAQRRLRRRLPGRPAAGVAAAARPRAISSAANPANCFFYLITAVHGLHLLGGLVALGTNDRQACWRGAETGRRSRLSVELCAIYWHFLLLVWLVLFGLLTGWTDDFVDICRQLLS